jgi:3-deoxy-D-manno-octulosonic-acid transferase
VWIHAVSLGEVNATRTLVSGLLAAHPNLEIVLSTTTDTGYARAQSLYPEHLVFRYPLDFSWVVRRVLRHIRPDAIVLMELELWYNLVRLAHRGGVQLAVVNGRLTSRSARRFGWVSGMIRPMFASLSWVGAQTTEIAERFVSLGTARSDVDVVGSMKWDTVSTHVDGADALAEELRIRRDHAVVVLGSSGPGEETQVLDAWAALSDRPQLVIVPRKPERFDEVARLIKRRGCTCVRRSQPTRSEDADSRVILGDTMGELRKFYALSDVVIVGRTFVALGGSDPMEVAALGKPIIVGPHYDNFADPVTRLQRQEAITIVDDIDALSHTLQHLLSNTEARRVMGEQARSVVIENQGATQRTIQRLTALLNTHR